MAPPPRVVFVTGCSEGGIGWHLCVAFAAAGCRVFATARRVESMAGLAERGCVLLACDVTDEASVKAAVAAVLAQAGQIDVCVNNAGIGCAGPLCEVPLSRVRACYEANVFGLLAVTQAVTPSMVARRAGTLVNIASIVGQVGTPFAGGYSSSKAAVINATDVLRVELAPFRVRVLCVCPGAIRSRFGENTASALELGALKMYASFRDTIAARATASQNADSTPGDAFAARVVREVLRDASAPLLWVGSMSSRFWLLTWLPLWVRDRVMARRFGLDRAAPL